MTTENSTIQQLKDIFYITDEDNELPNSRTDNMRRRYNERKGRKVDPRNRRMIAWDGEGIDLNGYGNPQSYVLFGCSVDVPNPLLIEHDKDDLSFFQIADYALLISEQYPNAFHVGYFFHYDQNMIVKSLAEIYKVRLYKTNKTKVRHNNCTYVIEWTPRKRITITRYAYVDNEKQMRTITIDDMGTFFMSSFVSAYSQLFPGSENDEQFQRTVTGKAKRSQTTYADLPEVLEYWQAEIVLLERMAERFRQIMYDAGFIIRDWYGPGAIANYLRRTKGLGEHEYAGKCANMPHEVHEASKFAYFGGRFERFWVGRISERIHVYDINSAYPFAFSLLPSLSASGRWIQRTNTELSHDGPNSFVPTSITMGVYRIKYFNPSQGIMPLLPQPLPHRDRDSQISYPGVLIGWYWWPEAVAVARTPMFAQHCEITECWEWIPGDPELRPWAFMQEMYDTRLELKKSGNPTQMAFKLGINSLYGKMAQKAGWKLDLNTGLSKPPVSHTLPLAGWVTSYCRAMILRAIYQCLRTGHKVIAVETDSVITTCPPGSLNLRFSEGLGDWSHEEYDEIMYIQSGVYMAKQNGEWKVKSRGLDKASMTYDAVRGYLQELEANVKDWPELEFPERNNFLSIGTAISRSTSSKGINFYKMRKLHCRWEKVPKRTNAGDRGKRRHTHRKCSSCVDDKNCYDAPHPLRVFSNAFNPAYSQAALSVPYRVPWEPGYMTPQWEKMDQEKRDEILESEY